MRISINESPKEEESYLAELSGKEVMQCAEYFLLLNEVTEILFLMHKILPIHANQARLSSISDDGEWQVNSMKNIKEISSYSVISENEHLFFWELSVVKYNKLFDKKSSLIPKDIFSLKEDMANQYFRHLRNKHFVHPVNVFQFSKCFAELSSSKEAEKKFLSLGILNGKKLGDSEINYETFIFLCFKIFSYIIDQIIIISKNLDAELRTQDIESLYKLPYCKYKIPSNDQITTGRQQFNNKLKST